MFSCAPGQRKPPTLPGKIQQSSHKSLNTGRLKELEINEALLSEVGRLGMFKIAPAWGEKQLFQCTVTISGL